MKKIISAICIAACACVGLCGLVACGDGNGAGGGKTETYTFEAEYTNLDGLVGGGVSIAAEGVFLIQGSGEADKAKGWSEGYYIGCTYAKDFTLTFDFNSDKAETGKISLRLGSEIGNLNLDNDVFGVVVNGKELTYSGMTVTGSEVGNLKFYDKAINESFEIKEGANTIQLIVKENTLYAGQQGGPMIDCIKVSTKAELTWSPKTDNPDKRVEI